MKEVQYTVQGATLRAQQPSCVEKKVSSDHASDNFSVKGTKKSHRSAEAIMLSCCRRVPQRGVMESPDLRIIMPTPTLHTSGGMKVWTLQHLSW